MMKAIGETDQSKRRAAPFVSFSGSLTVEAALILPIYLGMFMLLAGLFRAMFVCEQVNHHLCQAGRKLAAYSVSCDGCSTADLYQQFFSDIGSSHIDQQQILGGYGGILLSLSDDRQSEMMVLSADYRIKIPGYFVGAKSLGMSEKIYVRAWLGGSLDEGNHEHHFEKGEMVYVAANGVVYHTDADCTYLWLSIHQCQRDTVDELRNRYGAKYSACERCGSRLETDCVYITDTGTAWHTDKQCSGLKREWNAVDEENAKSQGLRPCARCGGH